MRKNNTRQPPISILLGIETRSTELINVVCHAETISVSRHFYVQEENLYFRDRRSPKFYFVHRERVVRVRRIIRGIYSLFLNDIKAPSNVIPVQESLILFTPISLPFFFNAFQGRTNDATRKLNSINEMRQTPPTHHNSVVESHNKICPRDSKGDTSTDHTSRPITHVSIYAKLLRPHSSVRLAKSILPPVPSPQKKRNLTLDFDIRSPRNLLRYQRHVTLPPSPSPSPLLAFSQTVALRSSAGAPRSSRSLSLPRDAVVALVGTPVR